MQKRRGGKVKSLSMTGMGAAKIFDWQHNRYTFISCNSCGYTEVYDLDRIAEGRDTLGGVLELLFG